MPAQTMSHPGPNASNCKEDRYARSGFESHHRGRRGDRYRAGHIRRTRDWAGYPLIFTERMSVKTNSHQCGTAVMGTDPYRSVLNPHCRVHDVDNLWGADSSCFPSSAALNPALTIAANAPRVAAVSDLVR
jgi:choline dehydrogenase-like flavoprotein